MFFCPYHNLETTALETEGKNFGGIQLPPSKKHWAMPYIDDLLNELEEEDK